MQIRKPDSEGNFLGVMKRKILENNKGIFFNKEALEQDLLKRSRK